MMDIYYVRGHRGSVIQAASFAECSQREFKASDGRKKDALHTLGCLLAGKARYLTFTVCSPHLSKQSGLLTFYNLVRCNQMKNGLLTCCRTEFSKVSPCRCNPHLAITELRRTRIRLSRLVALNICGMFGIEGEAISSESHTAS